MPRQTTGPRDPRGTYLAILIAAAVLAITLGADTQSVARRAGYPPAFGRPIAGRIYAPWASLGWMMRWDAQLHFRALFRAGEPLVGPAANEPRWLHRAFARERTHLLYDIGGALVVLALGVIVLGRERANSDLHGAARWATGRDVRRSSLRQRRHGVVLAQTHRGELLVHAGSANVLAVGPPGTGKTDGIARPTLSATWPHSAIVFDPADELARLTAPTRAAAGQRVHIFDPRSEHSARINPIAGIAVGDVDAVRAVLAAYFFADDGGTMSADARYFEGRGLALATAVVAHTIERGTPTLEAAARWAVDPAWESDADMCDALCASAIPYVAETGGEFRRMTDRQRSPFVATMNDRLELFRAADVARVTNASDVSPADLRRQPTTLYLVVRERDQAALTPLMRMILTRMTHDLTAAIPSSLEQSILLLIDEFPLLRAPAVVAQLATFRKYRVHAVLLAQSVAQLRHAYGQNETITGMCDVRVFFASGDAATQELAEQTCGQTTRWAETVHRDHAGRAARGVAEAPRSLLLPHELADLARTGEVIVSVIGEPPIRARRVSAHADERFL